MRKRFILLATIVLALYLFCMPSTVFAKSLFYADNPSSLAVGSLSVLNSGKVLVTGQCNVQTLTVGGYTSAAGDYVIIYDGINATGTQKFDISIGTAKTTIHINLNDAEFSTGVYADSSADTLTLTVGYTQ